MVLKYVLIIILIVVLSIYCSAGGIEGSNPDNNHIINQEVVHQNQPLSGLFKLNKKQLKNLFETDAENEMGNIDANEFFRGYQSIKSIHHLLTILAKQYPHLARVITIGKSAENRELSIIQIGNHHHKHHKNNHKPIIWIHACIHAREWIACATACYVTTQLIHEYIANNVVTVRLLDAFDFYIMPVVNPDGYEYTHAQPQNWINRFWRKNRSNESADPNCVGVDLNRNFDFHWNTTGVESNPCSEVYPGLNPESERETAAIAGFIWRHKHLIKCYVTLHAYGQYVLYPWSWSRNIVPNGPDLHNKATIAIKALASLYNSSYTVDGGGHLLYEASGTSADWAYGKAGIKYSNIIELRDSGDFGFLLPPQFIEPTSKETFAAIRALASDLLKEIY